MNPRTAARVRLVLFRIHILNNCVKVPFRKIILEGGLGYEKNRGIFSFNTN
jgi:hypothetical protein